LTDSGTVQFIDFVCAEPKSRTTPIVLCFYMVLAPATSGSGVSLVCAKLPRPIPIGATQGKHFSSL